MQTLRTDLVKTYNKPDSKRVLRFSPQLKSKAEIIVGGKKVGEIDLKFFNTSNDLFNSASAKAFIDHYETYEKLAQS